MDWWPISLYVNNERPPFDDKDVRWALSYFIDRQQIVDVGLPGRVDRRRRCRCRLPGAQAVHRRGQGPAREVQHARVQPQEGRGAPDQEGLEEGRAGDLGRRPGQPAQARHHRLRVERARDRPGARGAPQAAGRRRQHEPAARLRRPLPEGPVHGRDLRPRRRRQRPVLHAPALPERHGRRPRRAPRQLRAVEERGVRQDRRRRVRHGHAEQDAPHGALPQGDGDLAARAAGHPARPQHPPHPDEHDLLDELAHGGDARTSTAPSGTSPTPWCSGISSRRSSGRASCAARRTGRRAAPSRRDADRCAGERPRRRAAGSDAVPAGYLLRRIGRLPPHRVAGRHAELLPAAAHRAGPRPGQAAPAGAARRVRPGRHRGDGQGVRPAVRPRPAALGAVPQLPPETRPGSTSTTPSPTIRARSTR